MSDEINGQPFAELSEADRAKAIANAQALVTEFNTRLAGACTILLNTQIPVLTVLEVLAQHQAKLVALIPARKDRKLMREKLIAFLSERLAEAEVQRLKVEQPEGRG